MWQKAPFKRLLIQVSRGSKLRPLKHEKSPNPWYSFKEDLAKLINELLSQVITMYAVGRI